MIKNMNKLCPVSQSKIISKSFFEYNYTHVLRILAKICVTKVLNKAGQSKF